MRFHVLGSGSAGNASLLTAGGVGVLVDLGFGPRTLARRLEAVGAAWSDIHAAVLSHIHSDHWNENTLRHLLRNRLPLYCHPDHIEMLRPGSSAFCDLHDAGLVRTYNVGGLCRFDNGLTCRPIALRHDGGMTCGFRFEWDGRALGYVTDLGSWNRALVDALADVDLLALEFNHDIDMELSSGRAEHLIRRVLGKRGHLSNEQAGELLSAILNKSVAGRLQHLVLLHLSRDCNRTDLAHAAAYKVRQATGLEFQVHLADQDAPLPVIAVERIELTGASVVGERQMWLPGWEGA